LISAISVISVISGEFFAFSDSGDSRQISVNSALIWIENCTRSLDDHCRHPIDLAGLPITAMSAMTAISAIELHPLGETRN
jgi:hypothetical protein